MADESPRWMLYAKKADFNGIAAKFGVDAVIARILTNRDVTGDEAVRRYLYGTVEDLYSPHDMRDLDLAADIIRRAIDAGKKIRVVGDYDIDGVCSTYFLLKGLARCGADVDYQIPERIKDGYGINENIIRKAADDGVDLIVTCDNGIAAYNEITLANELGIPVVVTDHHEIPRDENGNEVLPPALAVADPHREDCHYPFSDLCGGVVAYKLIQVLYELYGIPESEWLSMLEFAAVATVGDVMPLRDENRILVKEGLKAMPATKSAGLRALIDACGLDIENISAFHIGFVIGPCLNAGGRLKSAREVLELLLCEDEDEAREMAFHLQQLNEERKSLTQKGVDEALAQVEERYHNDPVLVIYLPDCHESIAGIVAGRIRENYNRPTLIITRGEGCVKGSGRSIPAYSMFEKLSEAKDLLTKFGGHPMAAGFSLNEADIDEFRQRLNENAGLTDEDFATEIWIDAAMPLDYITEDLIDQLTLLEPCGQGNEKPKFAQKGLRIRDKRILGKNRNAVRLNLVTDTGFTMEGIIFTDGDDFMRWLGDRRTIDIVYYPEIDEYNGNRKIQVRISDYK